MTHTHTNMGLVDQVATHHKQLPEHRRFISQHQHRRMPYITRRQLQSDQTQSPAYVLETRTGLQTTERGSRCIPQPQLEYRTIQRRLHESKRVFMCACAPTARAKPDSRKVVGIFPNRRSPPYRGPGPSRAKRPSPRQVPLPAAIQKPIFAPRSYGASSISYMGGRQASLLVRP